MALSPFKPFCVVSTLQSSSIEAFFLTLAGLSLQHDEHEVVFLLDNQEPHLHQQLLCLPTLSGPRQVVHWSSNGYNVVRRNGAEPGTSRMITREHKSTMRPSQAVES